MEGLFVVSRSTRTAFLTATIPLVTALGALPSAPASPASAAGRPHPVAAAPATPTATFSSRVTARTAPVRDRAGRTWGAQPVGLGSWNRATNLAGTDIAGTRDDDLYRTVAWGVKWYWLPVPAKGSYRVRILTTENYWNAPRKRVFDIRAEGRTVASNVDIFAAAGRATAHDISFVTTVQDGQLDLDFVSKIDRASVSAIEVTSVRPLPRATIAATSGAAPRMVRLAPTSFYYQKVTNAPLARNSAAASANLAKQVATWGSAAFNSHQYNASYYRVGPNQRKVRVAFNDCQRKRYTPPGLFTGRKQFLDVPVPPNAVPAAGTDAEMTIFDPAADKLWEFWQMRRNARTGQWSACWGGRLDNVSTSTGTFEAPYGVSASGLVMAAGMITQEEIRRGRIDHAMYLGIMAPARFDRISWPANRSDGNSADPDALMIGQRLRLDPSIDVSTLDLTPVGRTVAKAAQEYGFIVSDSAGAVGVVTEAGSPQVAAKRPNPWDRLLAGPSYGALEGFPWQHVQVIAKDYGKPRSTRS